MNHRDLSEMNFKYFQMEKTGPFFFKKNHFISETQSLTDNNKTSDAPLSFVHVHKHEVPDSFKI